MKKYLLFLLIIGCGSSPTPWSKATEQSFITACVESAPLSYCNCSLHKLEERFTEAEILACQAAGGTPCFSEVVNAGLECGAR